LAKFAAIAIAKKPRGAVSVHPFNATLSMSIIPTISSGTAGPLGVQHLPRLWQKASLDAVGKLHSEYPAAGAGFDQMTLNALGIDRQAFLDYIAAEKPTYVACEAWCTANGSFDDAKIAEHNAAVAGYNHDDDTRGGILSTVGRDDDGSILDAVNLNNLEDWQEFHGAVIAG
jgi:hypothetical protein